MSREEKLAEFVDWAQQHITGEDRHRSSAKRNMRLSGLLQLVLMTLLVWAATPILCQVTPVEVAHINDGGYVYGVAVSGDYAYVTCETDGLRIYSLGISAPPELRITITSTSTAIVSWPAPSAAFVLQHNLDLGPANWTDVTNLPVVVAGRNQVLLPVTAGSQFYRLRSP
jgi:hypothetical protein